MIGGVVRSGGRLVVGFAVVEVVVVAVLSETGNEYDQLQPDNVITLTACHPGSNQTKTHNECFSATLRG